MPPSLSIVIPSHNRPDLLRACLSTVCQYAPAGTEVLVVDDGSPQQAASAVAASFAGVRVLGFSHCRGFCTAANAGIEAAEASIIGLLNDDTEVTAGWADAALARFQDASVAAVAPLVLCWPGEGKNDGTAVVGGMLSRPATPTTMTAPRGRESMAPVAPPIVDSAGDRYYVGGIAGKRGHRQTLGPAYLRACRVFGASASSAFYRREVLMRVGAFPESFGAYFEDVDLAFRLHWAGYQVLFEPASRVLHHVSASYGRPQRRLLELQSRNEERVFWRNLPGTVLARALPSHLAVLAAKACVRWQEGSLAPFLTGRLRLLREVPALLRHRRWLRHLGAANDLHTWGVERRFWG